MQNTKSSSENPHNLRIRPFQVLLTIALGFDDDCSSENTVMISINQKLRSLCISTGPSQLARPNT